MNKRLQYDRLARKKLKILNDKKKGKELFIPDLFSQETYDADGERIRRGGCID